MFRKLIAPFVAASIIAAPVAAQSSDRVAAPTGESESLAALAGTSALFYFLAAAVLAATAIIIIDDVDEDEPVSP